MRASCQRSTSRRRRRGTCRPEAGQPVSLCRVRCRAFHCRPPHRISNPRSNARIPTWLRRPKACLTDLSRSRRSPGHGPVVLWTPWPSAPRTWAAAGLQPAETDWRRWWGRWATRAPSGWSRKTGLCTRQCSPCRRCRWLWAPTPRPTFLTGTWLLTWWMRSPSASGPRVSVVTATRARSSRGRKERFSTMTSRQQRNQKRTN